MAKASKIPVAVMNNPPAAVSIQRPCYAMATTDGQSADITMYGEIVEEQPVDWWTDEPIPGQYIIESEFLDDLNRISGCDSITIHMDSLGGDAGVSILIHNKLRELAAAGAKLTCIVDGVAMSGGSLIMCACDTVKVNPSSLVMIHKCWSSIWGAYNADDLRKAADANDAWDKSQVSQDVLDEEKKIMMAQMANDPKMASKPEQVREKIVMGKMNKFYSENCLLQQEFVRGDVFTGTVEQYIADAAKKLGGKITFVDAIRFEKGEGIEKKQENFAEEIAKMVKG